MPVKESEKMVKVGVDKNLWRDLAVIAAKLEVSKKVLVNTVLQDFVTIAMEKEVK